MKAHHRGFSGTDVQVRGSLFLSEEQEFRNIHSSPPLANKLLNLLNLKNGQLSSKMGEISGKISGGNLSGGERN
jgi:hypothetical protein